MNERIPDRVLEILEWPAIQGELRARCATEPGKKLVDVISPLEPGVVRAQIRKVTHLKELIQQGKAPDFSGITDIEPMLALAEKGGILKIEDLALIKNFSLASGRIIRYLREQRDAFPGLAEELARLDKLSDITGILAASVTDTNELNDGAYPELRRIRSDLFSVKQEMEKSINKLIHSRSIEPLLQEKVFTTRNDRYVILVKSTMRERVRGTVHDISASGATCYIEPQEITPLNNKALMLEKELQAEIARILRILSAKVSENAGPLRGNLGVISGLDLLTASALFSIDTKGSEPEISEKNEIILYRARHPILYLMGPETVVANDIDLGASSQCLIISGANTGGKTVLLKTIGLSVLFAMFGMHVTAGPDSRIGVFNRILADIGDDQSLSQSLSTFSGQIVVINEMLSKADDRTLVIIDEIIVGTNPRQGAALAQAILESLIETGARIVVTTHYSELKDLPSVDGRFLNASVSFNVETLRPTYRLIPGLPGVSYAIEIAENYGLPGPVVSRSRALLDSREISIESLIEKMQKYEQELTEKRARLDEFSDSLAREKNEYDGMMRLLEKRLQEIKQKEGIDFLNELKEYRKLLSGRVADLQKMDMKEAGRTRDELREIEDTVRDTLRTDKGKLFHDRYAAFDPGAVKPGDRVLVLSLEKEGTVESIDPSRRQAAVLLGSSIKSTFSFDDLHLPAGGNRAAARRRHESAKRGASSNEDAGEIPSVIQTSYNTIDLRGKRVEEGILTMERDFDRMVRGGIDIAVVIHGHGTGAMKEAVRDNLKKGLYASGFRPGGQGEGGDGVTVVRLRA
jgi:DNA mismatch repair protein MutS2